MRASLEEELREAHQALAKAELDRDVEALKRLIHEQFMGVDPSGALLGRDDVIETYTGELFILQSLVVEEQHVRVAGDTGVVTADSIMRGRTPTGDFERRVRFSDVYVREGGAWRLFASHVTPLSRSAGFHS
ncbi:MAG TPA: nuclear transport factor 2 family protein [Longimicrobium sp.]|nr:nuclear transport factor 2 family protein [Longimicrobium sp.]